MKKEEYIKEIRETLKCGFTLSENQVAKIVGVSASTIAHWRRDGVGIDFIEVTRPNKTKPRYLYPIDAVAEFLANRRVRTA